MRAFQVCESLSAVIRTVLVTGCLLRAVRGDGTDSEEEFDIKYVLIGVGIGLFLVAGYIIFKVCFIRKQVQESSTDYRWKRPSEPHPIALSHLSQSEHPVVWVSMTADRGPLPGSPPC